MASFKIKLDLRTKLKNGDRNLCVLVCHQNKSIYLKFANLSEAAYDVIFTKQSTKEEYIDFRQKCAGYIARAERIFNELEIFDEKEFRRRFNDNNINHKNLPKDSVLLSTMFEQYVKATNLKHNSKKHYQTTLNVFTKENPDLCLNDITTDFLLEFEKDHPCSKATMSSYMRDLRAVVNYYIKDLEIQPVGYKYPFGRRKYVVSTYYPPKIVMSESELTSVLEFNNFITPVQKYSRDIWVALYLLNGSNFADLLRLKWCDITGDVITFTRKKTETTRRNNIKQIVVDYDSKLRSIFERIGDINSVYVLAKLKDPYTDSTFENKCTKLKKLYNKENKYLSEKLKLSTPLTLDTARDTFATMLYLKGVSIRQISELMGHSSVLVTEHYLGSLSNIQIKEIKKMLV
jgi:integrase